MEIEIAAFCVTWDNIDVIIKKFRMTWKGLQILQYMDEKAGGELFKKKICNFRR